MRRRHVQQALFRRGGKRRGAGRKPTGRRADSQADLANSVIFPVGFAARRIVASPFTLIDYPHLRQLRAPGVLVT